MRKTWAGLLALAVLTGCNQQPLDARAQSGQPGAAVTRTASPAPAPAPTSGQQELRFPQPGATYESARALLLSEGATTAPDKVSKPHATYKELDCWGAGEIKCTALFLFKRPTGWKDYIVVGTTGDDAPKVVSADWATPADGHPSIPPPTASDIPNLPKGYAEARASLLALGFKPSHAAPDCSGDTSDGNHPGCLTSPGLPEVSDCSGTGEAYCTAFWVSPDPAKVLKVTTIGEPQPGRIYHLEWASAQDLAELPAHWRP